MEPPSLNAGDHITWFPTGAFGLALSFSNNKILREKDQDISIALEVEKGRAGLA